MDLSATASRLIASSGRACIASRVVNPEYCVESAQIVGTTLMFSCNAVATSTTMLGEKGIEHAIELIIAPSTSYIPQDGDSLLWGSDTFTLGDVSTIAPAGVPQYFTAKGSR